MTTKIPAPVRKMMPAAKAFVDACRAAGWSVGVAPAFLTEPDTGSGPYGTAGCVVSITARFTPNDREAFVRLDGEWYGLLSMLKARGGSMWGTDGSGVGGHSAMLHGCFNMKVSGVSNTLAKAIWWTLNG